MGRLSGLKSRFVVKGSENIHGKDAWLDNDDIRPLALKDRTWTQTTYFTFWFSAVATGTMALTGDNHTITDISCCSRHLVFGECCPSCWTQHVGGHWLSARWLGSHCSHFRHQR